MDDTLARTYIYPGNIDDFCGLLGSFMSQYTDIARTSSRVTENEPPDSDDIELPENMKNGKLSMSGSYQINPSTVVWEVILIAANADLHWAAIEAYRQADHTIVRFADGRRPYGRRNEQLEQLILPLGPIFDVIRELIIQRAQLVTPTTWQESKGRADEEKRNDRELGTQGGTLGRARSARELIKQGVPKTTACKRAHIDPRTYDRYVVEIIDWEDDPLEL